MGLLMGYPDILQNLALDKDLMIGIIGTIISNFLITVSIRKQDSKILLLTIKGFINTLKK